MLNPSRDVPAPEIDAAPPVLQRRAGRASDGALTGTTRMWLRRLPSSRRPLRLCELYPRVANRLAWCWSDVAIREQTLQDLLNDQRGGRLGFPDCVVRELQRLRDFDSQLADVPAGPPWWRAMVKGVRS
jgi:hypothetical protein